MSVLVITDNEDIHFLGWLIFEKKYYVRVCDII